MRRNWISWCVPLALIALLAGCGAKKDQQAAESSTDSLLASNPSEPAAGSMTPQTDYQKPAETSPVSKPASKPSSKPASKPSGGGVAANPGVTVPEGTPIKIAVDAKISSETAQPGDTWTGVVKEPVVIGTSAPIPAGSTVQGVVTGVAPAKKGDRAFLVLAVRSINVGGTSHAISAGADSIIAGSTRARNLGAIAGGAAAGALIGKAIGGGKGALVGGLLGGGAATGAVVASKGYQVELKEGTEMTFNVRESVVLRQ